MTERTGQHEELVKLSDSTLRLEVPVQDVRGLVVYDRGGERLGSVEDLYVDTEGRKVRFLDIRAGDFLGVGEKHFLIPVEAVASVVEGRVTIDQGREKVMGSPDFGTNVVPEYDLQRDIREHYGY